MYWSRMYWSLIFLYSSVIILCDAQNIPFLSFLQDGTIGKLTQMATRLAASAAQQTMQAQRDEFTRAGRPEVAPIPLNGRPSEIIGQSITNALSPTISKFLDESTSLSRPHPLSNPDLPSGANGMPDPGIRMAPMSPLSQLGQLGQMGQTGQMGQVGQMSQMVQTGQTGQVSELGQTGQMSSLGQMSQIGEAASLSETSRPSGDPNPNPNLLGNLDNASTRESLIRIAEAFLGSPRGNRSPPPSNAAFASKQLQFNDKDSAEDLLPTIRQLAPGAAKNFGLPQGKGCLPFVGEFMQAAYGNCVKEADEKTWDLWGGQINNALLGGNVDLLKASKETCKRGVERQQCGQLRRAISDCDILGSIQIGTQIQRALKRCEEVSGMLDQNPAHVLEQVNGLIGGEVAQGFLHKFLG